MQSLSLSQCEQRDRQSLMLYSHMPHTQTHTEFHPNSNSYEYFITASVCLRLVACVMCMNECLCQQFTVFFLITPDFGSEFIHSSLDEFVLLQLCQVHRLRLSQYVSVAIKTRSYRKN